MRPGLGPDADRAGARLAHTPDSMASMPWCCLSIPRARETWRRQGWRVLVDSPRGPGQNTIKSWNLPQLPEARELQGPSRRQAGSQPPALELVGAVKTRVTSWMGQDSGSWVCDVG